jgi:ADP-heptose:LPS heptosyltransferase
MIPSRVVFFAEGQLGDLLVTTPAIRSIKKTFPHASIAVVIFQRRSYFRTAPSTPVYFNETPSGGAAATFASNPHVDQIIEVDLFALRRLGIFARLKAEIDIMLRLRRKGFDTAIVFPRDRFVVWAFASGAAIRAGQKQQVYHQLLTHAPDIHKRDAGVVQYYCTLARAIGAQIDSLDTEFFVPDSSRRMAEELLAREGVAQGGTLVAIHPGASAPDRIWPLDRFAKLIDELQAYNGVRVLLCGGEFDQQVVKLIRERTNSWPIIINTGNDLPLFAGVLSVTSLFIGNASGPRHLAVAVGTPSITFFAKSDERDWAVIHNPEYHTAAIAEQFCEECGSVPPSETYGSFCIRTISVEAVLKIARERLRAAQPADTSIPSREQSV